MTSAPFSPLSRADVYQQTLRHFFAPVADVLYEDPTVTEVMINGPDKIYVERGGEIERLNSRFRDSADLQAAVNNLAEFVNRRVDRNNHSMDARLPEPEPFRVHVIIPPASRDGTVVTIRKFSKKPITRQDLLDWKTLSDSAFQFLDVAIRLKRNILVSGGTGTGKTSLLNALSASIDANDRVIVIEDSSELKLNQEHTVYLESVAPNPDGTGGATIRDLFVDSLRMRPDRILVGEVRRGEALDLVQSMLSGHDGCMSTIHASNPRLALVRLETLCLMSDVKMPVHVARTQVASAIHLVVQIVRHRKHRLVSEISEIRGMKEEGGYETVRLFKRGPVRRGTELDDLPELEPLNQKCLFAEEARDEGLDSEAPACAAIFS